MKRGMGAPLSRLAVRSSRKTYDGVLHQDALTSIFLELLEAGFGMLTDITGKSGLDLVSIGSRTGLKRAREGSNWLGHDD
jgi:hypothetical protein